jgi:hypothetical protein
MMKTQEVSQALASVNSEMREKQKSRASRREAVLLGALGLLR